MNKLIHLLERTLNSRSKKLTKQDEYMFFSPFVSHYKPKLQINMSSQKWHCWVSDQGGHSLYLLFKKINKIEGKWEYKITNKYVITKVALLG